jgi:hypothetical protein
MSKFYSTRQVAKILNVKPDTLNKAVWQNRINPPLKSPSGNYLWTVKDVEHAAWVLHCYDRFTNWLKGGRDGQ